MIEREWREASDLRVPRIGFAAIVVVAAVLRFWALGHGIPHSAPPAEADVVTRAVGIVKSGSLQPAFFDHPPFYVYLQASVFAARFMKGAIAGEWDSLDAAGEGSFYLWGRVLSAVLGVVTVVLVFHLGMRWGARHALLAAGLMAVLPLHVRYSHYALTETALTFFVALTLLLALRAHETNTVRAFAIAGAAAGISAGVEYAGALAIALPLLACWMTVPARPSRIACALAAVGASVGAFLLAAPYTILDWPSFLDGFARAAAAARSAPAAANAGGLDYLAHVQAAFGWPALLLMVAGVLLAANRLVRGPGRVRWALVAGLPLLSFAAATAAPASDAGDILAAAPALSVLAATAVISGVSLLRRYEIPRAPRTALITLLTIAALLPPSLGAIAFNRSIARRTTVDQAADWIGAHVPRGARVVLATRALRLPTREYRVTSGFTKHTSGWTGDASSYEFLVTSSDPPSDGHVVPGDRREGSGDIVLFEAFEESQEVARFSPSADTPGPEVRIYRVR